MTGCFRCGGSWYHQGYPVIEFTIRSAVNQLVCSFVARIGAGLFLALTAALTTGACADELAGALLREQQAVAVQGAEETWALVWEDEPQAFCGAQDVATALTCPCAGWAYGESGQLLLVRMRGGIEIERMALAPLFSGFGLDLMDLTEAGDGAQVQRWPLEAGDLDRFERGDPDLVGEIEQRPVARIMLFADYDRDGNATEFLVQVGTLPCLKSQFTAVGISVTQPHLHALTSVAHPERPLIMPRAAWQAMLESPGPTTVATWACGDHGSEVRREIEIAAAGGVIRVAERAYSCPADGSAEQLITGAER